MFVLPPAKSSDREPGNHIDSNAPSSGLSAVALIQDRDAAKQMIDWIVRHRDLSLTKVVLLYVLRPEWMVNEPYSGVEGSRMIERFQSDYSFARAVIANRHRSVKRKPCKSHQ